MDGLQGSAAITKTLCVYCMLAKVFSLFLFTEKRLVVSIQWWERERISARSKEWFCQDKQWNWNHEFEQRSKYPSHNLCNHCHVSCALEDMEMPAVYVRRVYASLCVCVSFCSWGVSISLYMSAFVTVSVCVCVCVVHACLSVCVSVPVHLCASLKALRVCRWSGRVWTVWVL